MSTDPETSPESPLTELLWLEARSSAVAAWDRQQNDATDTALAAWEDREALRDYYASSIRLEAEGGESQPTFRGAYRFYRKRPAGRQRPALYAAGEAGVTLLVDPNDTSAETNLDWFHPSPSGSYVAYGVSQGGDEQSVLHVVDVSTGRDLGIAVPHTSFANVAWLPDESGFYFGGGDASDHVNARKRLRFLSLATRAASEAEPIELDDPYVNPQLSADGRYLVVNVSWEKPRAAYYRDLGSGGPWKPFMSQLEGESYGTFAGDTFYALTTSDAPRGRVLAIPMRHADDPTHWTEVVREGDAVIRSVNVVADQLVLTELHGGGSRIRVVSLEDGTTNTPDLPGTGSIDATGGIDTSPFSVAGSHCYFTFDRFERPPEVFRLDLTDMTVEPAAAPGSEAAPPAISVTAGACASADGTCVPYFLVHRNDVDLSTPQPTLMYGYGGWNVAAGPEWLGGSGVMPFVEAGGVYVSASLRGGSELGRDWWLAGRREAKQNTFDDLYAVAEHLISSGIADPARLAVSGRSNGGLLTAVAATQRPDLFSAVVSEVPLTDMLRALDHPYLTSYREEYGDPHDPAFAEILRAYSPVHNVRDGVAYPATLILSAASDLRCQPWNGRKLAALMQSATSGEAPVLLRVAPGGHGGSLTVDRWIDRRTDVVGFVMQTLGMRLARPPEPEAGTPQGGTA